MHITVLRQCDPVSHDRLHYRQHRSTFRSKTLAAKSRHKPRQRTDRPRSRFLLDRIFTAGIHPDLVYFLLPHFACAASVLVSAVIAASGYTADRTFTAVADRDHLLYAQRTARHLHISQPVSLSIPGNLVDPRAKRLPVLRHSRISIQTVQQTVDSLHPQRRTHVTRKKPALPDQPGGHGIIDGHFRLQILLQQRFVTDRNFLIERLILSPKPHDPSVQLIF